MKKIIFLLLVSIITLSFTGCQGGSDKTSSVKTAKELISKFEESKLTVIEARNMETDDFGIVPKLTDDAMIFTINVENDQNARVFKFNSSEDLTKVKEVYDKLGKETAMLFSHTYAKGNFLIQANGDIKKEDFEKYTKIMNDNIK